MTSDIDRYAFLPGAPSYPTIVDAKGCYLIASDGRRILDGAAGAIVGNIGWGRTEVADAAAAVMPMGYVIPLWPTPSRLQLIEELVDHWLPDGFHHAFFTSGGSESTDSAIRLARAYQVARGRGDRWKVVGRHPSYHGMTTGTMAVASHSTRQKGYEPLLLPFPKVPWDDAEQVLKVIEQEDPDTIAGFIVEPITGAAGACLTASDEYWRVVNQVCRDHDILLIADEVMTGFGRTGRKFGHEHFPFHPDVIVGGKGLGGGYVPLGAVTARDDVVDALRGSGFMYFTFTGNDAACAAGAKVLEIVRREQLVERVAAKGPELEARLRDALGDHPAVTEIRGRGFFYGIELTCSRDAVVAEALSRDLWVYPAGSGPVAEAVMVAPPFVIDDTDLDQLVAVLAESIDAVHRGA
ncbi:MAG TPA: aminotransferase class III-fold pyridoxal phosphate-dependent enzyme [Ilumatobacteraceae bacterium]|nr:aminotransferase class III-fold pyridoxal phosphate-dependent enzyme [Ilumatobacteraceae bacterium]HUC33094.1 aminotransferase class III-fold pyridoxal phosphate-dependent enzyme [Ilumatobacteraceae bacterium]